MRRFIFSCVLMLLPGVAAADWALVPEQSNLSFGSIKNESVGETHHFTGLSGAVDRAGHARVAIDLATVETHIDIRNERMAKHIFKAASTVTVKADLPAELLAELAPGESWRDEITVQLNFAGVAVEIDAPVFVMRLSPARVLAVSDGILWVTTEDLGIDAGIDRLQEIAELSSITRASPVSFRFTFEKTGG